MITPPYYQTFYPETPEAVERLRLRLRVVAGILDLDPDLVPGLRDAWVENHPNPEDPSRGHLLVALYTECRGDVRGHAVGIFGLRVHPRYAHERDDAIAEAYKTFYFRVPADELSETMLASLVGAAVAPVDTDARWASALGIDWGGVPR